MIKIFSTGFLQQPESWYKKKNSNKSKWKLFFFSPSSRQDTSLYGTDNVNSVLVFCFHLLLPPNSFVCKWMCSICSISIRPQHYMLIIYSSLSVLLSFFLSSTLSLHFSTFQWAEVRRKMAYWRKKEMGVYDVDLFSPFGSRLMIVHSPPFYILNLRLNANQNSWFVMKTDCSSLRQWEYHSTKWMPPWKRKESSIWESSKLTLDVFIRLSVWFIIHRGETEFFYLFFL